MPVPLIGSVDSPAPLPASSPSTIVKSGFKPDGTFRPLCLTPVQERKRLKPSRAVPYHDRSVARSRGQCGHPGCASWGEDGHTSMRTERIREEP